MSPTEPLSEYRLSTVLIFPNTVWIGCEYGLGWVRVRFCYPLGWKPRGPCETSWCLAAKIVSYCLKTIFDSQLPSPKLSPKMPPKLSLAHKRGLLSSFKITPVVRVLARQLRGQNCLAAIFCLATSRCLFWPTGSASESHPQNSTRTAPYFHAPKNRCDFSAIFWQLFCETKCKNCNLRCALKTERFCCVCDVF